MGDNAGAEAIKASSQEAKGDSERLARRRLLLGALGKGGAVAAASVPLVSFAAPGTLLTTEAGGAGMLCTQSGVGSNFRSATVSGANECRGRAPGFYVNTDGTAKAWPPGYTTDLTLGVLMNAPGDPEAGLKVLEILNGTVVASLNVNYWIAAAFNAQAVSSIFPYTLTEVQTQFAAWRGGNTGLVNLYITYLSDLTS